MGGALDSSRFRILSMALGKPANDISAMVIGGHGDTTMIPLRLQWNSSISISFRRGVGKVAADTMVGGATHRSLGTSAWYAPERLLLI
jgi:malate dehydrogenase